jgi:hypothetical protein
MMKIIEIEFNAITGEETITEREETAADNCDNRAKEMQQPKPKPKQRRKPKQQPRPNLQHSDSQQTT